MIDQSPNLAHRQELAELAPGHAKGAADDVLLHNCIVYEQAAWSLNASCKTLQQSSACRLDRALWLIAGSCQAFSWTCIGSTCAGALL